MSEPVTRLIIEKAIDQAVYNVLYGDDNGDTLTTMKQHLLDGLERHIQAQLTAVRGELSACKESPGGCGYWREAAGLREQEQASLQAALAVAQHDTSEVIRQRAALEQQLAVAQGEKQKMRDTLNISSTDEEQRLRKQLAQAQQRIRALEKQ